MSEYESWGRYPKVQQKIKRLNWAEDTAFLTQLERSETVLPYGQGRSYGDVCLNDGGTLISTSGLKRFIAFDESTGILRAEAGVTLEEILTVFVPRGWFLPVTPGTKFVSLGGAIANDIHGKNHHRGGTFGSHVLGFELLRSDGKRLHCSNLTNQNYFISTIGGIGLTGLILWADLRLRPIAGPYIEMESIKFTGLDEFFEISSNSDRDFEYTVSWLDCLSGRGSCGKGFGRGIFMRGNHSELAAGKPARSFFTKRVPFDLPSFCLNSYTMAAFNVIYYGHQRQKISKRIVHYDPFFYPLDSVLHWNRIYGRGGFMQFQCVVPASSNHKAIRDILKVVVESGQASFLSVIKEFGEVVSPGLLSFPRKGVTICMDFAIRGEATFTLLRNLDRMVRDFGGAVYPAKDACMARESYKRYYPRLEEFSKWVDPKFSSSFWRRVS